MDIPTTRTSETGHIQIDSLLCTGCGACVQVCQDGCIEIKNQLAQSAPNPLLGCVACGHCMAVCPHGAIVVSGRTLQREDLIDFDGTVQQFNYNQLLALFQRRRSMRNFLEKEIDPQLTQQILNAASFAPMGVPPSDVGVVVWQGAKANAEFLTDFVDLVQSQKWIFSKPMLQFLRPFIGKEDYKMLRNFVVPALHQIVNDAQKGKNILTYNAPLAMYFYGSPTASQADPVIAATLAMYAGEALGLSTCMIGMVHPMIQNGIKAQQFRKKYAIEHKSKSGLVVIFGYAACSFQKGIKRSFAKVSIID